MKHLTVAEQLELLRINAHAVDELSKLRDKVASLESQYNALVNSQTSVMLYCKTMRCPGCGYTADECRFDKVVEEKMENTEIDVCGCGHVHQADLNGEDAGCSEDSCACVKWHQQTGQNGDV